MRQHATTVASQRVYDKLWRLSLMDDTVTGSVSAMIVVFMTHTHVRKGRDDGALAPGGGEVTVRRGHHQCASASGAAEAAFRRHEPCDISKAPSRTECRHH